MNIRILCGHVLDKLAEIPPESVHCVVTSPPYFGLRDYKIEPQVWPDGWLGSLGLEPTLNLYLDHMVNVCRAIRHTLRKDGCFFLNIGDSYVGGGNGGGGSFAKDGIRCALPGTNKNEATRYGKRGADDTLKRKDLMLVPHRLARALQADGWWLRDEIVWAKANPMPESAADRCTRSHEFVFMLTKMAKYFYDAEAIKEDRQGNTHSRGTKRKPPRESAGVGHENWSAYMDRDDELANRNKRSVWMLATQPFPDAHFATFPPALVEPCILAGTSAKGVCPKCGAPWGAQRARGKYDSRRFVPNTAKNVVTLGWAPTCGCHAGDPVPATVLDPFGGSGTTGLVANRLGRNAILIDLNPEYAEMARSRIEQDAPLFTEVAAE